MKKLTVFLIFILLSPINNNLNAQGKYSTLYYQRATLFEELPVDKNDIIFLGNSITHFGEWHEIFNNPNIKNRGISGDIAEGVFDRLEPILKGEPSKIFLLIGINDVAQNKDADSILRAITRIVVKVAMDSPRTKLYIQSLLPVNDTFGKFPGATTRGNVVIEINKKLQKLCADRYLTYIDVYSALKCGEEPGATNSEALKPEYTNDGLHLLGKGYLKWAEVIKPYLEER
ncbi:MAG: sialate O-acetylesterase [Bacteroidetes bacterium HGW-Bacteroidetes-5]|jgi:lysophospholipase L1-like esterase|nr:MAG: sialate O-acetylesterase [Bacteroidetes bacterium HGW-Bacteroidetes-5]